MNSRPQPNRNHLTTFVFIFLLLGVLRCFVGDGYAQSIGVNFVGSAGPAGTLASSDVAGVPGNAQAFWNNAPVSSGPLPGDGSLSNLVDSAGQQTSLDIEWRSINGVGDTGSAGPGANFTLMRGYLPAATPGIGVIFRDIPYPVYDVIVYMAGPPSGSGPGNLFYRSPDFDTFPPAAERYCPLVLYSQNFDGSFVEATPTTAGNYYRVSGLTFSSVGIGSIYFPVSAVEIIPVPEPSTITLSLLALASLGHYVANKRRR